MKKNKGLPGRGLGLIHLGCPKNQVDSEEMLAALATDGWTLVGDPDDAEVLVVNTCGFIEAAREESLAAIRQALGRKKRGRTRKVIVAGCLAQRYAQKIAEDFPGVDAVVGTGHTSELPELVRSTYKGERPIVATPPCSEWQEAGARLMTTPPWTAYVRIGEGCDHTCSFCAIPGIRGAWRSRPAQAVVSEVRSLAEQGLMEAVLIGQDTTLYGHESRGEWSLAKLIRELDRIENLQWQRLMYAHPGRVNDELIELFGSVRSLVPYIDIPLQHGSDSVLKRMRRAGSAAGYVRLVEKLRQANPDIAIRTTFLVGFPGETESEFEELLEFVRKVQPDHAGVFRYSHEEGTGAFELDDDVPADAASERAGRLMELQAAISASRLKAMVSREIDVLVEGDLPGGRSFGRSTRDAPEVDGTVTLTSRCSPGTIVRARVSETSEHDVVADVVHV